MKTFSKVILIMLSSMTFVIPVSAQNIRSFINGAKTILTHKNKTSSPYSKTINHDNKTINNDTQTVSKAIIITPPPKSPVLTPRI